MRIYLMYVYIYMCVCVCVCVCVCLFVYSQTHSINVCLPHSSSTEHESFQRGRA